MSLQVLSLFKSVKNAEYVSLLVKLQVLQIETLWIAAAEMSLDHSDEGLYILQVHGMSLIDKRDIHLNNFLTFSRKQILWLLIKSVPIRNF